MPEFKLPDPGEGLTEAEIVSWKVKVGDVIAINDVVVEIETAKSLVELPSPYAGTVLGLLVAEGETVPVGTPIIAVGDPADTADLVPPGARQPEPEIDLSNPAATGGGEGETLVGRTKARGAAVRRARTGRAAAAPPAPAPVAVVALAAPAPRKLDPAQERVLAKPPVRKLARDLGVDLARCPATGPNGTVSRADVEAVARAGGSGGGATTTAAPSRTWTPWPGDTRETHEPIKGVRKMMGQAMSESASTIPHVTEWVTVDVTRSMQLIEELRARPEFAHVKVSPLLLLARAVVLAMPSTPEINSVWDDAAQEVVLKHYANLGIAAATPRGLVVPTIPDAHQLSLVQLAEAIGELTATARAGRTQPAEMSGGTFTITNVGVFGIDAGTPIINPGQSAIMALGAVRKQPWVVSTDSGDAIAVRQVTTLALSFDHRHIDGEKGSRFLADVAGILHDPSLAPLL